MDVRLSEIDELRRKVKQSREHIASLEAWLEEAAAGFQKYREESQRWRDECADEAERLARTVREMEGALRKSREREASLIRENMRMRQKVRDLEMARREEDPRSPAAAGGEATDDVEEGGGRRTGLPTYRREGRRRAALTVRSAWRGIVRRTRKLP